MVLDTDDLNTHPGIFGVERTEWEAARDTLQPMPDIIATKQPDAVSYLHDDSAAGKLSEKRGDGDGG